MKYELTLNTTGTSEEIVKKLMETANELSMEIELGEFKHPFQTIGIDEGDTVIAGIDWAVELTEK